MYRYAHAKRSLVMDGTFHDPQVRDNFKTLAADLNVDLKWIEIRASEPLIKKRVAKKRAYSDANFKVYREIKKYYTPLTDLHLSLESRDNNLEEMLSKAMAYLMA